MLEVWRDVVGHEGSYIVSNLGTIIKLPYVDGRNARRPQRVVKAKKNNRGYWQVRLYKDGTCEHWLVHRIVAMAFIPNDDGLQQVNHKDEDKDNNGSDNLEWCTNLYNRHYGSGYARSVEGHDYNRIAEQNRKLVEQYDIRGNLLKVWKGLGSAEEATGVREANIRRCCYGRGKSAGGYVWKYAT